MLDYFMPRTLFLVVPWLLISAEEDSCPAPFVANLTCYPENGCSYDRSWERSCLKYLDIYAEIYYTMEYKVLSDDDSSLSVDCFNMLSLKEDMFRNITFQKIVQLHCNACRLPEFPIVQLFNRNSHKVGIRTLSFENADNDDSKPLPPVLLQGLEDSLQELSLKGSNIRMLEENTFRQLTNLKLLSLEGNNLTTLPASLFHSMSNLRILNLQKNHLQDIPEAIFSSLSHLEELDLSCNELQILPPLIFRGLKSLTVLNLSDNDLMEISSLNFSSLSELKRFNLSRNQLTTLSSDVFQFATNLENLDLSHNPLAEKFPSGLLLQLTSLSVIDLENCNLTSIPESFFSNCTSLSKVILKNNVLQEIPENIFENNKRLKYVDLSTNKITSLPREIFASDVALEEINFSVNNLTTLPAELFRNTVHVKRLLLNSNSLKLLDENVFKDLNMLQVLNLSRNELDVFNVNLNPNIEELSLSHNNIVSLPDDFWLKYKKLKNFDIQFNRLSTLDIPLLDFGDSSYPTLFFGHNNIETVSVEQVIWYEKNISSRDTSLTLQIAIYLHPNPFDCNCKLSEFAEYVLTGQRGYADVPDVGDLTCRKPDYLAERAVQSVPLDEFYCDLKESCPRLCRCGRRRDGSALVNCSMLGKTQLPHEILPATTVFNFTGNDITSLEDLNKPTWKEVEVLYFDSNEISSLDSLVKIPEKLKKLSLKRNLLTNVPSTFMRLVDSTPGLTLALGDNPWDCSCSILPFRLWLSKNNRRVEDSTHVICSKPVMQNGTLRRLQVAAVSQDDICPPDTRPYRVQIIAVSTVAAIAAVFVLISSILYYRNRQLVVAYIYIHFNHLFSCFYHEQDLDEDKLFDAFVCYSSSDRDVTMSLIAELENKEPQFKLCIHERDWLPGNFITANIANSVQNSRRTILVISEEFLKSVWFPVEFQTAYYQMLKERIDRMIVIVRGELPPTETLDEDLQFLLKTKTYLVWGERWFCEKLRYAMPHRKNIPSSAVPMTLALK